MKKGWKQMDVLELAKIEALLGEGISIPEVAKRLWRSKNTLYEACKVNGIPYGIRKRTVTRPGFRKERWQGNCAIPFSALAVFRKRRARRSAASVRKGRIAFWSPLERYVLDRISGQQWSPEQIVWRWKLETGESLSKDTVYRFVRRVHPHLVRRHFRRRGRNYLKCRWVKYRVMDKRMIDERPEEIESRAVAGHWEGDTIVWIKRGSWQALMTSVERKTGYLAAAKLESGSSENVYDATVELARSLPAGSFRSITYDNGAEFAWHRLIEHQTGATVYFARPYHSWERGTNENTNGLIRQYFPKGTDFRSVSEEDLRECVEKLNARPRKRLWYLTPHEVFSREVSSPGRGRRRLAKSAVQ